MKKRPVATQGWGWAGVRRRLIEAAKEKAGSLAILPVEGPVMQVHHGFDVKGVVMHAISDGVRKTVEVEFAILTLDFALAFRLVQDAPQSNSIFLKKVATQPRVALLIPERGSFQLLGDFRMSDDAHGAWPGCPESPLRPAGYPPGPRPSLGNGDQ